LVEGAGSSGNASCNWVKSKTKNIKVWESKKNYRLRVVKSRDFLALRSPTRNDEGGEKNGLQCGPALDKMSDFISRASEPLKTNYTGQGDQTER